MSKKYTIQILGYGSEIVQAKYSDEEINKIITYMDDSGHELDDITLNNLFSEIIDDREIYDWFEQDDMGHYYGGEIDGCSLYINGEENDIHQMDEDDNITIEYNRHEITGKDNIITTVSQEKGILFDGEIELDDDEVFDTKKLKLIVDEIEYEDYEASLIKTIEYNNEEITDNGPDTRGKGIESYMDLSYENVG